MGSSFSIESPGTTHGTLEVWEAGSKESQENVRFIPFPRQSRIRLVEGDRDSDGWLCKTKPVIKGSK